jgi:hypothetical protein
MESIALTLRVRDIVLALHSIFTKIEYLDGSRAVGRETHLQGGLQTPKTQQSKPSYRAEKGGCGREWETAATS